MAQMFDKKPGNSFKPHKVKTVAFDKPYKMPLKVIDSGVEHGFGSTRKLRDYGVYKAQKRSDQFTEGDSNLSGSAPLPAHINPNEEVLIEVAKQHSFGKL